MTGVMPSGHVPVILKIRYSTMTSVNMTGHDRNLESVRVKREIGTIVGYSEYRAK